MDEIKNDEAKILSLISRSNAGDCEAKEKIISIFTPLVKKISRKYSANCCEQSDFIQEGYIGLLDAITKFNPKRGAKFTSYAHLKIRREISRAIERNSNVITVPRSTDKNKNAPISIIPIDLVENSHSVGDQTDFDYDLLRCAINKLSAIDSEVIKRRYGLGGYETESLKSISESPWFNVSAPAINKREKRALLKLKKLIELAQNLSIGVVNKRKKQTYKQYKTKNGDS